MKIIIWIIEILAFLSNFFICCMGLVDCVSGTICVSITAIALGVCIGIKIGES